MAMITNNDYEKAVLIVELVKELKDRISEKENITDVRFTPVISGYEVGFLCGDKSIRITAEVKGFFAKKLIIKKQVKGKVTATYKVHTKAEISACAEQVLSE